MSVQHWLKAVPFWIAMFVGSYLDGLPAGMLTANDAYDWHVPLWAWFLLFWLFYNLYTLTWIFCLEEGIKIKWLLNFELKFKLPFLLKIWRGLAGLWLALLRRALAKASNDKLIQLLDDTLISEKRLEKKCAADHLKVQWRPFEALENAMHKQYKAHRVSWSLFAMFGAYLLIPYSLKFGNIFCAIRRQQSEILFWLAMIQVKIVVVFFFGKQLANIIKTLFFT